jgi:hypothetical protein
MKAFKLDNEPKITTGFKTPEGYFDGFSEKILQKIENKEPKVISIFARRKTWVIAVAAVFVVAFSIPMLQQFQAESSDIDQEVLENYITQQSTLNEDDFVSLLDENDIQKMKVTSSIENNSIEDELSSDTDLEEYIIN